MSAFGAESFTYPLKNGKDEVEISSSAWLLHDRSASTSRVLGVTALMHSADISLPGHASLQAFIGFQAAAIG